jgi:DNA-binding SARP family transcriptional activator/PAS domain-containing protein
MNVEQTDPTAVTATATRRTAESVAQASSMTSAADRELASSVYEHLPYGLVVVDESGNVLSANPAAIEMSWRSHDGEPPTTCNEMFACRGPGGPCHQGCLAKRASQLEAPLPEIRIDTPPGSPVTAVWVTAAPLGVRSGVLLHLRAGDARDRRRRSEPHWIKDPELTIKALGRIRVDSREGPLGGNWLQQRSGQILKYLICERDRVVQAEEIAEALWPFSGREALSSVRHFIHGLRDKLEPGRSPRAPSRFVVTVRGGYAINRRHVRIDVDTFTEAARGGLDAAERGEHELAGELLELAMALYRGDLLEDEPYAEWAMPERDRLRAVATSCLRALSRLALMRADRPSAITHLERLAEFEPFDSDVHRELLRVLLAAGRRSEAMRRYSTFRARLGREFGAEPEFALADLQTS